jgi:hypothetical protein
MLNLLNILQYLRILIESDVSYTVSSPSEQEKEAARAILPVFLKVVGNCTVKESLVLEPHMYSDLSDEQIDVYSVHCSQVEAFSSQTSDSTVSTFKPDECIIANDEFSLEYVQNVLAFVDTHPEWKFKCIKKHFRRLKHPNYITRFRKYIVCSGSRAVKINLIKAYVYGKFVKAREKYFPVHDLDLKRWAIHKAIELDLNDFVACDSWIYRFKIDHNISSRKITKLVTKNYCDFDISRQCNIFLEECKKHVSQVDPSCVINTDQSGFNYELHSQRTLSQVGEKSTFVSVSSMHSISHSYTIQPIITMAGRLLPKFLVCLQEPSGEFGPRIFEKLPKFKNIYLVCSSSGKLSRDIVSKFNECVIKPFSMSDLFILLIPGLDSLILIICIMQFLGLVVRSFRFLLILWMFSFFASGN